MLAKVTMPDGVVVAATVVVELLLVRVVELLNFFELVLVTVVVALEVVVILVEVVVTVVATVVVRMHAVPLPYGDEYPRLHAQLFVPGPVVVQFEFIPQLPLFVKHEFTGAHA